MSESKPLGDMTPSELLEEWATITDPQSHSRMDVCKSCKHSFPSHWYLGECEKCGAKVQAVYGKKLDLTQPFDTWQLIGEEKARADAIAAELDKRCEAAGIHLYIPDDEADLDDYPYFVYYNLEPTHVIIWDNVKKEHVPIPASDQHALEAWLLQKHKA